MCITPDKIRNIAVLGHQGAGKTSLVESLFYVASHGNKKGEVEKRNTISDFLVEEQSRMSSVSASIVPLFYEGYKLNLIDVPGNADFIGEALGITRLIKGAILVIDASSKVQVSTIRHYKLLRKRKIPTIIFVNKMDKENVNFEEVLTDIRKKLGKKAIPFCYPIGHEANFDGFVNVVDLKARKYNGVTCEDAPIFEDKKLKVFELHNMICEAVAQTDDILLDKFFLGEPLSREEIHQGLRKGVLDGELDPVVVGSAKKDIGIHTLLQMLIDYLPNPSDLKPYVAHDVAGNEVYRMTKEEEPFSAYVFKTIVDPYLGTIHYIKVNSGELKLDDEIYVSKTNKVETVTALYSIFGKKITPVTSLGPGDIGAIGKLQDVKTGMTLSDAKSPVIFKEVDYPTAVIFQALVLNNRKDEDKIGSILQKMQLEDPTLEVLRNKETKQLLIGGLSTTHLAYHFDRLKNQYKIDFTIEKPQILYKETITKEGKGLGRYIKQSGGSGYYGVVEMKFEPSLETEFTEEVFGGAVPKNYFPAVEKGFIEALQTGQLAGFPVIHIKATLLDGKYHSVDSNEMAFKMAAVLAFKDAYMKCQPTILEPVYRIFIRIEHPYLGDVLSDLNQRRAKIIAIDEVEQDVQEIVALVPESEIMDYATYLKAMTQGSGFFNRQFEDYEEVPENLKEKIIKAHQKKA